MYQQSRLNSDLNFFQKIKNLDFILLFLSDMAIPTPTDKPCPREPEEYSTPGTLWSICPGNFVPSAKKESSHFLGKNPFIESAEYRKQYNRNFSTRHLFIVA